METTDGIQEEHAAILDTCLQFFESVNVATVSWDEAIKIFALKKQGEQ